MGSRRPQEGRRNQMQNKHERFWEEAQPQVGVWAASAVYGGTEPQVSLSGGALCWRPPPRLPPQLQSDALLSRGPGCRVCEAPGLPPLRRERNRTPAPGDSGILGLAPPGDRGEGGGQPLTLQSQSGEKAHLSHQSSPCLFIELVKEGGADSGKRAHGSPTTEE